MGRFKIQKAFLKHFCQRRIVFLAELVHYCYNMSSICSNTPGGTHTMLLVDTLLHYRNNSSHTGPWWTSVIGSFPDPYPDHVFGLDANCTATRQISTPRDTFGTKFELIHADISEHFGITPTYLRPRAARCP